MINRISVNTGTKRRVIWKEPSLHGNMPEQLDKIVAVVTRDSKGQLCLTQEARVIPGNPLTLFPVPRGVVAIAVELSEGEDLVLEKLLRERLT